MDSNKYYVFFDAKQMSGKVVIGVVVYDWFNTEIEKNHVVVDAPSEKTAPNILALMGWIEALKLCIKEDYEDVVFVNQQKLIFDWFQSGNFGSRKSYYEQITNLATEFTKYGSTIDFEVRTKDGNVAKKYVSGVAKNLGIPLAKGNLMDALANNKKYLEEQKKGKKNKNNVIPMGKQA